MKVPEVLRTYCPSCGKHTLHNVRINRKGKESTMSRGRRKYTEVKKGYGGSPRTPKKPVYKVGKRTVLVLECSECKKKHQMVRKARTKKTVEIGHK